MIVSVSEKSINVLVSHYICPSFRSVVIADDEGGLVLEKKKVVAIAGVIE